MADDDLEQTHVEKLAGREQQAAVAWMLESAAPQNDQQQAKPDTNAEADLPLRDQIAQKQRPNEQWWQTAIRNVSPIEFLGGALDYADNVFETISNFGVFERVRNLTQGTDKALMDAGVPGIVWESGGIPRLTTDFNDVQQSKNFDEFVKSVGDVVPDIGDPQQSGIARGMGKFTAGYLTAGRMLSGVKSLRTLAESGRFGASAVAALKGAISDFSGLGAEERNLANFVEQFPALQNPISDFLSAKDESPEVVNKLKTAIVGAGLGMAMDGIFAGLRSIRSGKQVAEKATQLDELASGLMREADTQKGMISEVIGNPDDARLLIPDVDVDRAASSAKSSFKETRGTGTILHGSSSPVRLDEGHYSDLNIYGQGFYTTDAADVASGYMKKGSGNNPSLYVVSPSSNAILYDMDGQMDRQVRSIVDDLASVDSLVHDAVYSSDETPTTLRAVYDEIRAQSKEAGVSTDEVQGIFDSIRTRLEEIGYSGLLHSGKGGGKYKPHEVRIYFNPGRDLSLTQVPSDFFKNPDLSGSVRTPIQPVGNESNRIGDVFINWSRIDSPDDVKTVMQDLANRASDSIDEARRGTQTFGQIADEAATEDAWKILTERAQGQPLNASQSLAVRQLWTSSATKVLELSRRVEAGGSVADQVALRKMIAIHAAIQEQVIGIRTETARALAQWRIPAGESDQFLNGMGHMLDQMGGSRGDTFAMAKAINSLASQGRADATDAFLLGAGQIDQLKRLGANTSDIISQLYYFSLLSGPKTHMRNTLSNTAMLLANVADRKSAAILGDVLGGQNVPDGEAAALAYGELQGALDAFRVSAATREAAAASGNPARSPFMQALTSGQSADLVKGEVLPGGAFDPTKLGVDPSSPIGRVMDWIDTATRSPTNALAAGDAVFRTSNYNGEVHALAFRQAAAELEAGVITREAFDQRAAELARNPDTAMKLLAQRFAEVSVFANRPPHSSKLFRAMNAIANVPILGKIAMPFRKTPYNIAIEFAQRSPTAPFTQRFRDEIAAGGARADIAWAKFLTGNLTLVALADIARRGFATGEPTGFDQTAPGEYATRRQMGERPMSLQFKSEDGSIRTFSFRGLEPFSTLLGMAANVNQILGSDQFDAEDKDLEDVVVAATAAIATQVTAPSFMSGMSDLVSFMDSPDRYAESFSERLAGTVVPNVLAETTRAIDPTIRDANGMIEAIMARTPGLSKTLPPNTDRWGTDLTRESGLGTVYDAVSPFYSSKTKPEPIDAELFRLEKGLPKPAKSLYIDGVKINMKQFPKEYTRYVKLAGNEIKETVEGYPITTGFGYVSEGGGLKDELNAIVEGRHSFSSIYELGTDGPDGDKAAFIQGIVNAYRDEAKAHLLQEFPALRAHVVIKRTEQPERVFQRDRAARLLDRTE